MSIRLMASAMETALPCSQKLVLLVLCDRANDQGGSIWESVGEIARKSSLSDRQVQRTLRGFEAQGLLRVTGNIAGGAPGLSRRYHLHVPTLDAMVAAARAAAPVDNSGVLGDDALLFGSETGDMVSPLHTAETGDIDDQTGDMVSGRVTPMSPYPSVVIQKTNTPHTPVAGGKQGSGSSEVIHSTPVQAQKQPAVDNSGQGVVVAADVPVSTGRSSTKGSQCIATWLADCKARGVKPIPADDPVWAYAEQTGIPEAFIGLAWAEFKARRVDSGKRQKDWPATFRNAVRGNWFRLWWTDGKTYSLTTQGQQAQALHREARAEREQQRRTDAGMTLEDAA